MILATAGHVAEHATTTGVQGDSTDMLMLLDADLAILGAEPGAYQAYVNGVRAEYAHVDDDQWLVGRSRVLQHFLDRPRLFATGYMHDTFEHRALANVEAELAALTHRSARN
jgi:predicted metal-dependent HD superfamily phosphohydrolase